MGRIVKEIVVDKKKLMAVFDTGSERSYIIKDVIPSGSRCTEISPFEVGFGGKKHIIRKRCTIKGKIDNLDFDFSAHLIDTIGDIDRKKIDVVIGATAMEEWDINPLPDGKKLDLRSLKKREFVEL